MNDVSGGHRVRGARTVADLQPAVCVDADSHPRKLCTAGQLHPHATADGAAVEQVRLAQTRGVGLARSGRVRSARLSKCRLWVARRRRSFQDRSIPLSLGLELGNLIIYEPDSFIGLGYNTTS